MGVVQSMSHTITTISACTQNATTTDSSPPFLPLLFASYSAFTGVAANDGSSEKMKAKVRRLTDSMEVSQKGCLKASWVASLPTVTHLTSYLGLRDTSTSFKSEFHLPVMKPFPFPLLGATAANPSPPASISYSYGLLFHLSSYRRHF